MLRTTIKAFHLKLCQTTYVMWIPGHSRVQGNKEADALVKASVADLKLGNCLKDSLFDYGTSRGSFTREMYLSVSELYRSKPLTNHINPDWSQESG